MKPIRILLALVLVSVIGTTGFLVRPAKGTPTLPLNMGLTRSGVWLQNATETSWVVWNNTLYYIYTDRDLTGTTKQMKLVRFSDNAVIATFGSGYGCQDAIVNSGTLYVFATPCFMDTSHPGSAIVEFTSTNLTTWSSPTTIYTLEPTGQAYNIGIGTDGAGNFVISFDDHNQYWYTQYFVSRFLTSTNLTTWTDVGASNVLRGFGALSIHYHAGSWFMFGNTTGTGPWSTVLFQTSNFSTFTESRTPLLKPTTEFENTNTTDPSIITFNGTTYISYMVGDQTTYMRLTYATYNGTIDQLIDAYWQP